MSIRFELGIKGRANVFCHFGDPTELWRVCVVSFLLIVTCVVCPCRLSVDSTQGSAARRKLKVSSLCNVLFVHVG